MRLQKPAAIDENGLKLKIKENDSLPPRILSSDILTEQGRLIIEHKGEDYILRITRSGKLILTK